MAVDDRRQALLERVVDHWTATSRTDMWLRALAAEVGTSHRMLLYHFGSYQGLIAAAVDEVEHRQRRHLQQLDASSDGAKAVPLDELSHALWEHLASDELRPLERLFFGLYARLLEQGREDQAARLVASWIEPVQALLVAHGVPPDQAAAQARLGLAVTRGLLLDLLATGDRPGTDAAHRAYVDSLFR